MYNINITYETRRDWINYEESTFYRHSGMQRV